MSISYVLLLLALGLFGCAVWTLFWAIEEEDADSALQESERLR